MPPISLINKLTLLHKDKTYIIGKSSYSAIAGSPSVGALRQVAADAIGIDDAREHVLFFEDRELTDDSRDCRDEGLKDNTFILCRNWGDLEPQDAGESSSDDSPIRPSRGRHWSEQWPLERVLRWLSANSFSNKWVETFEALDIHGSSFLYLGSTFTTKMEDEIYPMLRDRVVRHNQLWDQTREQEEGKRLQRLAHAEYSQIMNAKKSSTEQTLEQPSLPANPVTQPSAPPLATEFPT